jgi:ribosomal protein L1
MIRGLLKNSKRFYDKKKYNYQKKLVKASRNQEDVSFEDCFSTLQSYTLAPSSIQAHIQVLIDSSKPFRGQLDLPFPVKKQKNKILVFCNKDQVADAVSLGAHYAGSDELIQNVLQGELDFNICLCTKEMFPKGIFKMSLMIK